MRLRNEIEELKGIIAPFWPVFEQSALDSGLTALKTANGIDHVARAVGGDVVGESGTATAAAATTLTNTGATFPTAGTGYTGHIVSVGPNASGTGSTVYGVILSNTTTIITVDYWRDAGTPGTVGTTPNGTGKYQVLPGGAPAWYMGLTTNANAPSTTDIMLATTQGGSTNAELWTASAGLNRVKATYAHTNGTATYTLSNTYTANANDGASNTINKIGIFAQNVTAAPSSTTAGTLLYTTTVSNAPVLVSGDTVAITDTITIS